MTGKAMIDALSKLTPEQLTDYDLSVKVGDEFFTVTDLIVDDIDADGILDPGSPVILSHASGD